MTCNKKTENLRSWGHAYSYVRAELLAICTLPLHRHRLFLFYYHFLKFFVVDYTDRALYRLEHGVSPMLASPRKEQKAGLKKTQTKTLLFENGA